MHQQTLKQPVIFQGIGLHSGQTVSLRLLPAAEDTGVVFRRVDLMPSPTIVAHYANVSRTMLQTVISEGDAEVSTVEHLMAALWACQIDNVIVEVNAPEMPAMDGSSIEYIKGIVEAGGGVAQKEKRRVFVVNKEHKVQDGSKFILARPSTTFSIDLTIDFDHPLIGTQRYLFGGDPNVFISELAGARTFAMQKDIDHIKTLGLAKGGSLANAVAFDEANVINPEGLRFADECVRHKLLDCIGDLYLAGGHLQGAIVAYSTGHGLNNQFLRSLFDHDVLTLNQTKVSTPLSSLFAVDSTAAASASLR